MKRYSIQPLLRRIYTPISCFLGLATLSFSLPNEGKAADIARAKTETIHEEITQQAVVNRSVLLNDLHNLIPLKNLDQRTIVLVSLGEKQFKPYFDQAVRYANVAQKAWDGSSELQINRLDEQLKLFNTVIFALSADQVKDETLLDFIQTQAISKHVIVSLFGQGEALAAFDRSYATFIWNPDVDKTAQQYAAMSLFGGLAMNAKLPTTFSAKFTEGKGHTTEKTRLSYLGTAGTNINTKLLTDSIDAVMRHAIQGKAAPGGVVMVVRDGNVIFEKAYGHHTYEAEHQTQLSDIFDLASITKIAATTPMVMRLTEQGIINLDSTMGYYLWQAKNTNKSRTKLRDVMLHEAGFIPYIPFYRDLKSGDTSSDSSATHAVKMADGSYIRTGYYEEFMWPIMLNSNINPPGKYVYSDISMYVMKEVSEHKTGIPIQEYIQQNFYRPLGMVTAGYLPRNRFTKDRIVPTEYDKTFRKTLLEGYVHDQGAAMAGGVAGHAGLFASANDLAIYAQLLLNRGEYGGERYFKTETVDTFTSNQSPNSRRGLGFDRKDPDPASRYPGTFVSDATFGHTGYTGTAIWMDPKERLIYIFLSNRVHPEVSDQLSNLAIRRRILDSIYMAIQK